MKATEQLNIRLTPELRQDIEALRNRLQAALPYGKVSIAETIRFAVSSAHSVVGNIGHTLSVPPSQPSGEGFNLLSPGEKEAA